MKLTALLLFAGALAFAGCAGAANSAAYSGSGSGGSVGSHCTTIACVPGVTGSLNLAIEIDPPNSATTAAITELPSVDLSVEPISPKVLRAIAGATVTATFTAVPNAAAPSSANVVLTVPSAIPGRPDLTFQAPTTVGASASVISGSVTVPQSAIGSMGALALIPSSPADQQNPPFSFPVMVSATLSESIPGDSFTINGTLVSAVGTAPAATFVARALQDGVVVSNAPLAQSNGSIDSFRLVLPAAITANGDPLTIQLSPQSPADPWFVSGPIAPQASTTALSIMLPAYSNLNQFNLNLRGSDDRAVVGALVHAQTVVSTSTLGSTQFARDGITDANGMASLSLLPGTAQTALDYQITVVPPTNSSSAAIPCDIPVAVTVGGSLVNVASAPTLMTIMLTGRPTLSGTVKDYQGYPLSNVTVTATQETSDNAGCTSATPAPTSMTSDPHGIFALALDPGTYQVDYDPPTGSAAPRFTEYGVRIGGPAALVTHDMTLPQGAAVMGTVYAPDGKTALPSATVRLFQVRCTGADCTGPNRTAPALQAVAVTDGNGSFRVAIAVPATP